MFCFPTREQLVNKTKLDPLTELGGRGLMQGGLIQLAPMGADARSQAKVCRDCLRMSAGWRSGGDWASVLQIVLAACGGAGEKCVVLKSPGSHRKGCRSLQMKLTHGIPFFMKKKRWLVASSGSHNLFTLICTMVPKKTPSHSATPDWRGFYHSVSFVPLLIFCLLSRP